MTTSSMLWPKINFPPFAGEGMFGEKQNYFKNGRIDQAALVSFIKDIKS